VLSPRLFAAGIVLALTVAACSGGASPGPPNATPIPPNAPNAVGWVDGRPPPATGQLGPPAAAPNIVYILTDDLSTNLIKYMPHVKAMQRHGVTFTHYFVTDSLCCPSRVSILTGQFPHNTKVYDNTEPAGGFEGFLANNNPNETFAPGVQGRGYTTGFFGKFLNLYAPQVTVQGQRPYISPGWSAWNAAGSSGYDEFNYLMGVGHRVEHFGSRPSEYLTNVLSDKASGFIHGSVRAGRPFLAEISTFATHAPDTPSPVDVDRYPNLKAPRGPAYGRAVDHAPPWLRKIDPLTKDDRRNLDRAFRLRVLSALAVDRMIGRLEAEVKQLGVADNTYFIFNSDNGFHLGEHNLRGGKQTAFDTDVRVPLIVTGPGVPAGVTNSQLVQNIDLAPTFDELAGTPPLPTMDGRSLVAQFHGQRPTDWRTAVLVEHHGPNLVPSDPDYQTYPSGNPPSYEAIRTADYLYVEYVDGEREFYNLDRDPFEQRNAIGSMSPRLHQRLRDTLHRMERCRGSADCWAAQHVVG
jgi:arylsulfatase A-like enzyme